MNPSSDHPLDTAGVERLLEFHLASMDREPCPEIEHLARLLAGETSPAIEAAADAHLAECEWCRGAIMALGRLTATRVLGPLPQPKIPKVHELGDKARIVSRIRRYGLIAAALLIILVGAVLIAQLSLRDTEPHRTELVIKGASDELQVAVRRGTYRFTLRSGNKLRVGDDIGLFYSSKKPGYLAVFGVDNRRETTLIYPVTGERSAALSPGERAPLPAGAVVNAGSGCEWLVGVFSDTPLDVTLLTEKIERAQVDEDDCLLDLKIDEARSVQVVPYLL